MESRTDGPAAPREQEAAEEAVGSGEAAAASWRARAWQEAPASLVRVLLPRPLVNRRPPPRQTGRGSNPARVRTVLWRCQRPPWCSGLKRELPRPPRPAELGVRCSVQRTLPGPAAAAHHPPVEQPRGVRAPRALLTSARERTGSGLRGEAVSPGPLGQACEISPVPAAPGPCDLSPSRETGGSPRGGRWCWGKTVSPGERHPGRAPPLLWAG